MTKETYIKFVKNFIKWSNKESNIDEVSGGSITLWQDETLQEVLTDYLALLCKVTNDEDDERGYSTLSYFLYELECGKEWKPGSMVIDGEDIKLQTVEDLADYIFRGK